ncbi:hypothetical protein [Flavobacterium sp.]|uniref:hypothetical protein n=1 Tax=Flavobacterium sp. TaxID=239 RepID=UPI0038FC0B6B
MNGLDYYRTIKQIKATSTIPLVFFLARTENEDVRAGMKLGADDLTFNSINTTDFFISEEKTLKEYTAEIIAHYLKKNNNDVLKTAKKLDIGKSTIYNLIKSSENAK